MAVTIRVWTTSAPACAEGIANQRNLRLKRTTWKVRPHGRKVTPQHLNIDVHLNIAVRLQPSSVQRFRPHIRRLGRIKSRPLEPRGAMNGGGRPDPVVKDLVLIGGGHSHVIVLKKFGMRPEPGVRITLISRDVHTPYSGMLPGCVAGHYVEDECHIDLHPLTRFAGARLVHCSATGIDTERQEVLLQDRPPIRYDILSIDIGITPSQSVPGAQEHTIPVKPIDAFIARWQAVRARVLASPEPSKIAVVGGGAGGVELMLAIFHRLTNDLQAAGCIAPMPSFTLFARGGLLPTHPPRAAQIFSRIFQERGIVVESGTPVASVESGAVILSSGEAHPFHACFWCTQGCAASWMKGSGLDLDPHGFLVVNECLQSVSRPSVFAAGDVHSSLPHPRPKAGVIAVRQGPPLAENLRRALLGKSLLPFRPQATWLSLISAGEKYAIASYASTVFEAPFLWGMKDRIDRRFMQNFSDLPTMVGSSVIDPPSAVAQVAGPEALAALTASVMRCGGCGAKVGAPVLSRVLSRLCVPSPPEVVVGLSSPDDAAVVRLPPGMVRALRRCHLSGPDRVLFDAPCQVGVHTVDFFRSFIEDPFVFGAIAANHALGDCFAMGAQPISALAMATLPFGLESKQEEDLFQMMAGAVQVLTAANCALVGGHTAEAAELSLGFAVNGGVKEEDMLRKGGMRPGDVLILTKGLGTGTLMAAAMRGKAKGRWVEGALTSMRQSSQIGAAILQRHGATACTDVTGFGLVGHLVEMSRAAKVDVRIQVAKVPLLEGAQECVRNGIFSSLQPSNLRAKRAISELSKAARLEAFPLLFDPQTAGGLLASLPPQFASQCLIALQTGGYPDSAIIGQVAVQTCLESMLTLDP